MNKEFDLSNVKTCVNAGDVCIGDYGIFADTIGDLKADIATKYNVGFVKSIHGTFYERRFCASIGDGFALFYPLEGAK